MKTGNEFDLGRFVRERERKGGTHHVFMSVPASLRPPGWPANITLPEEGSQIGSLHDPKFLARVQKAARCVNKRLEVRRELEKTYKCEGRKNTRALASIYFRTLRYRDLSGSRRYRNRRDAMIVVDWAERRGDPDFADFFKDDFEDLLAIYDDRESVQSDIRSILNVLCTEAVTAKFRPDNPVATIPWIRPEPVKRVVLWKPETIEVYATMARQMAQPGLAALIQVGIVVGQRLGDLRTAKHGVNYRGGRFQMVQSKTGVKVSFPLSAKLRELIESVRVEGSPFLFNNGDTNVAFTEARLGTAFAEVRFAVTKDGAPKMLLRSLRHSAVCVMVDNKVPLRNIAAVTGHRLDRVNTIINRYAIDNEGFADEAMRMVNRGSGGDDSDFDAVDFGADYDWEGGSQAIYHRPQIDPDRPSRFLGAAFGQHRLKYDVPLEWPKEGDESEAA
ncbi:hypothetical protein [Brevundimonas sp. SL161]|uniref:hypothetical protein n=1 Tax=Brevundimonas sp. SL161 TaxID=2804613 RepID=UPI003CF42546